ncbi:unnamed protein product [Microthlaspi erraticum]|uniref:FBD domain-containing protein n=1 Tax=Microthlaspi erraticum TaxID=1685480 RepID=A0A6D2LC19_9BRAS|nr:unnamed protein product [Microthlaspi erraticum]
MSQVKIEETVVEDRISELPQDLILSILRFAPIKEAVSTMLLSKRWFPIWTMIPTLQYKDSEDEDNNDPSVCWFLDKSLQLHNAPVIDGLVMQLDPTRLPDSLYNCATLKPLDLSHKILVDFPSSSCLPSLLALELVCVVYKDDDSPARSQLDDDNDAVDTGGCLVMDTPALNYFEIRDSSRDSYSIENMPCLEKAYISVDSSPKFDKFIASLPAVVLSLELKLHDEVECDYEPDDDLQLLWNQPSYVPSCLSSQLEIFEWRGYGDETEEEEFLTYILANSKCLKSATISLRPTLGLVEKKRVTTKLKDITRISTASQLLFK